MAKAKNKVIAGDYLGKAVSGSLGVVSIMETFGKNIFLDKSTVMSYELVTNDIRKSGTSAVLRGGLGAAVLGPAGLLAGMSAKNKGIYQVAINFKNGKRSLIQIDEKIYSILVIKCF